MGSASGGTGFDTNWNSNGTTNVAGTDLTFGSLATTGNSIGNLSGSQNRFGGSREIGTALNGANLLADGSELWFSVVMGYGTGGNLTNSTLQFVLGDEAMSGGNFDYNYNTAGATGLGVMLGRSSINGTIRAVQVRDTTFGDAGFAGNVYGTGGDASIVGAGEYQLIVGRITWGAVDDTIDLFLPGTDLIQPGAVHSTLTVSVDQSGYDTITFKRGDIVTLDEIRFGGSYADVVPVPEPSSVVLMALAMMGLCARRRRH